MSEIARSRNVAVVGPHHSGKTTLVEAPARPVRRDPAARFGRRRHDDDRLRARMHRPRTVDVRRVRARVDGRRSTSRSSTAPGSSTSSKRRSSRCSPPTRPIIVIDAEPSRVRQTRALVELSRRAQDAALLLRQQARRPGQRFPRHARGAGRDVRQRASSRSTCRSAKPRTSAATSMSPSSTRTSSRTGTPKEISHRARTRGTGPGGAHEAPRGARRLRRSPARGVARRHRTAARRGAQRPARRDRRATRSSRCWSAQGLSDIGSRRRAARGDRKPVPGARPATRRRRSSRRSARR